MTWHHPRQLPIGVSAPHTLLRLVTSTIRNAPPSRRGAFFSHSYATCLHGRVGMRTCVAEAVPLPASYAAENPFA